MKPPVERLLTRARAEADAGRAWRAKEILRGAISNPIYAIEPEVLEYYGTLLDALGDRYEAGKHLFLSGTTESSHADAIGVFLGRASKLPIEMVISQFPRALRRQGLGHLPDTVRTYLQERGASIAEMQRQEPLVTVGGDTSWKVLVGVAIFCFCLATLLVATLVGFVTMARWLL